MTLPHAPRTSTTVTSSLLVAALVASLGAYEFRTWEFFPDGSLSAGHDGMLRRLTCHLFFDAGCVLAPHVWLAVPLYAALCGTGAGVGMYVARRLSAKRVWPYLAGTACAVLIATLTTVMF